MTEFPNLPIEESCGHQSARVCIATYEILGPSQNGGIGTAYFSLATTLASAGHNVTILYLPNERSDRAAIEHWVTHFRTLGIRFVGLPAASRTINVPQCMLTARDVYTWLQKQEFDVIHFPELQGHGYYSVLAKHQRLDFSHTTLCVGTHSPISWIREQNHETPYSPDELEMDFMERQCVALADVVLSPSQYMLHWMQTRGWTLPAICYVQQNIALPELQVFARASQRGGKQRALELVFFGKLEERKGIRLFCDALDLLTSRNLRGFSVTFLGKNATVSGRDALSYIRARAELWTFPWRTLTDRSREAALRFLSEGAGRIAIIPSLEDNLPNTVVECLAGRNPFLASRTGGIPELIADSDVERVTFSPNASELADTLGRALRDGVPVARPAIDPHENKRRWVNWHAGLASRRILDKHAETEIGAKSVTPLVSVCLNYREGVASLLRAVGSLQRQSWPNLEVILSDSSEAGVGAESELDGLRSDFEGRGWQIIRAAEGGPPGTTRTTAVVRAHGDYVLFMDSADYVNPDAAATFVETAGRTSADVLTCFLALFSGIGDDETLIGHCPFLGAAVLSSVFHNRFGSRCIFIRKDAFSRVGLLLENSRWNCEDWEFLARAALIGLRLEVIPRPLLSCRIPDNSRSHPENEYQDHFHAVRPYAEAMPLLLRDLPDAAFTTKVQYERQYGLANNRGDLPLFRDEELAVLLVKRLAAHGHGRMASLLRAWLDYSSARSNLPESRILRIPPIVRELLRGSYHRFSHGFGSAFRDLRKPPPVWFRVKAARNNLSATNRSLASEKKSKS